MLGGGVLGVKERVAVHLHVHTVYRRRSIGTVDRRRLIVVHQLGLGLDTDSTTHPVPLRPSGEAQVAPRRRE